jgi:hypothetical protein
LAKLTGNSPKNIDLDAVKAYEAAGLPYTNTTVNTSSGLGTIDQVVSKTPVFGTKRAKTHLANDNEYAQAVEEAINSVGKRIVESDSSLDIGEMVQNTAKGILKKTEEATDAAYEVSNAAIPKGAVKTPNHLVAAFKEEKAAIRTLRASDPENFVLKYIDDVEKLIYKTENGMSLSIGEDLMLNQQKTKMRSLSEVPIIELVGTKRSLNGIIDWDDDAAGAMLILRKFQKAAATDLKAYGEKNTEWYRLFRNADIKYGRELGDKGLGNKDLRKKLFGEQNPEKIMASLNNISDFKALKQGLGSSPTGDNFFNSIKREKLADLIMGKTISPTTEQVVYSGFAKTMENPKTKELIKYLAGDKYSDLENFNEVAKAVVRRNAAVPNKSGTASTSAVLKGFIGAFSGSGAYFAGLAHTLESAAALTTLGYGMNWLTTNKSALKWGIEGAKKIAAGDTKAANIFAKRLERTMTKDLGEDFVKQFVALSKGEQKN